MTTVNQNDVSLIAAALVNARKTGRFPVDRTALPKNSDLFMANQIANACLEGQAVTAWKMGGTTASTQATFNVNVPYFGPLIASEVHSDGAELKRSEFMAPVVEPEIILALSRDIPFDSPPPTAETILDYIDWVALGLELPDNCLGNAGEAGVNWLVSDRCAAGGLVVGKHHDPESLLQLESSDIELFFNGSPVSASKSGAIIGGVKAAFAMAVIEFQRYGHTLLKGQLFATGGLCPAGVLPTETVNVSAKLGNEVVSFRMIA